jgi:Zn-dependent M28 family amino/carboxypeptidase
VEETPQWRAQWNAIASRRIGFTEVKDLIGEKINIIALSTEQIAVIESMADGTIVTFGGELAQAERSQTWNAVGKIEGSDSTLSSEVILLSAHMDHVGVRPNTPGEDKIFNGADDDASGCIAVLELAKILARPESRPKRTVYFVFFGSEEAGGFGSRYFVGTIPFPKERLVANLQFEMLGRPDPKVNSGELWLTGYERSDLGITLASKGARLVADPHPEQNFFQRSDNYNLARLGIVAHTVSSFGLHKDYHQPTDEIDTIDFGHMTGAIESLIDAVRWLVNSDFKPSWYEGKRP